MFRIVLCLLLVPCLGGCLAIAYPTDTITPVVTVPETDVACFKTATFSKGPCVFLRGGYNAGWTIQPVPVADGKVKPLEEKHFTYWVGCPLVSWHDKRWWSLYLYRPGYELVEVEPGTAWLKQFRPESIDVEWKPLTDPDEQAKVIDKLAGRGLWSNATPQFRAFCADEYERLSIRFPLASDDQRKLWLKKADDLRKIGTGRDPVGQPVDVMRQYQRYQSRTQRNELTGGSGIP